MTTILRLLTLDTLRKYICICAFVLRLLMFYDSQLTHGVHGDNIVDLSPYPNIRTSRMPNAIFLS